MANAELIERIDKLEEAVKSKSFASFCDDKVSDSFDLLLFVLLVAFLDF